MNHEFKDQVAIITGAGNGLGKSYALALAKLGAKVVVNDVGGNRDGSGSDASPAQMVVAEILAQGGIAISNNSDITQFDQVQSMVQQAIDAWGRVDILINNAGILRDSTFSKMEMDDFWKVIDVHLKGTVNCCKAVWDIMKQQKYGRIVLTSSASGLYGNFGQSNYAVAKSAMLGLMNVLHEEGIKYNIHVNTLTPTAATRMTEELIPQEAKPLLRPETITPAAVFLASPEAPSKTIIGAGAGVYARSYLFETEGIYLPEADRNAATIAKRFDEISDTSHSHYLAGATQQTLRFAEKAMKETQLNG